MSNYEVGEIEKDYRKNQVSWKHFAEETNNGSQIKDIKGMIFLEILKELQYLNTKIH